MNDITLQHPVTDTGVEYKALTMRRPKVKDDLRASAESKSAAEREVILFANLCGVPRSVIEELDLGTDYARLQEIYDGFFASAPKTSGAAGPSSPES